jgi:hypothetical protein
MVLRKSDGEISLLVQSFCGRASLFFIFHHCLELKMIQIVCAPGQIVTGLLHLCANSIKLFISRIVCVVRPFFSTNFSTQLLKSRGAEIRPRPGAGSACSP